MKENLKAVPKIENNRENSLQKIFSSDFLVRARRHASYYAMALLLSIATACSHEKQDEEPSLNLDKHAGLSSEKIFTLLTSAMPTGQSNKEGFLKDPALRIVDDVQFTRIPSIFDTLPAIEKAEWAMRTARGMYAMGLSSSEENFEMVLRQIVESRTTPEILNKKIFTDRNICVIANNQEYFVDDEKMPHIKFAPKNFVEALKKQNPADLRVFRAGGSKSSLEKTKNNIREYILSHKELTLVFETHGTPQEYAYNEGLNYEDEAVGSIIFGDMTKIPHSEVPTTGQLLRVERKGMITPGDLASFFADRYITNKISDVPMLVFSSCHSQNFIRSLYKKITEINSELGTDIPLPICMGDAEYGQISIAQIDLTDHDSGAQDIILNQLLSRGQVTIGNAIQLEEQHSKELINNISIFIPLRIEIKAKKVDTYLQIAEDGRSKEIFNKMYAEGLRKNLYNEKTSHYFNAV